MGGVKYDLRPLRISDIKFPWCGGQRQSLTTEGLLVQYSWWGDAILFPVTGEVAGSNLPVGKY
jgi:hypothetical protein